MGVVRCSWVALWVCLLCGCPGFQEKPATPPEPSSEDSVDNVVWPTEEEAKAIMVSVENLVRASKSNQEIYHIKLVRHEVKSFQFADEPIEKWMDAAQVSIAFPARVQYTRIEEYTDLPDKVEEISGTWWFYQDTFGTWTGKFSAD